MRALLLIATATLSVALTASAAGRVDRSVRRACAREFQEAYAEVGKSAESSPARDSEKLKSYPLYSYLQAERLRKALGPDAVVSEDVDKRAAAFIAENDPQPVARRVRRVWLESLARRTQWAEFLEAYKGAIPDDALRCQSFVARIALEKTEGLVRDISAQWLTPRSVPECKIPFDWMKEQGVLTTRSHRAAGAPRAEGRRCAVRAADDRAAAGRAVRAADAMGVVAREAAAEHRRADRDTRYSGG